MLAKTILATISTGLAVTMYYPLFKRILTRKTTGDFSKSTQWMILATQAVNGGLALASANWHLVFIYSLHILLVGATTYLVYKYYD